MSTSFVSERYRDPQDQDKRARWIVIMNSSSRPDTVVKISRHDEENPGMPEDLAVDIEIPFGVLAEIVGRRLQADKIAQIQDMYPRDFLGLKDQGGRAVMD